MSAESKELVIFADSDTDFYREKIFPVRKNLSRKYIAGKYDHALSVKLWKYVADDAAKRYAAEYGESRNWNRMFSVADRKEAAQDMADDWLAEMDAGNFDGVEVKKSFRQRNPIKQETLFKPAPINVEKLKYWEKPSAEYDYYVQFEGTDRRQWHSTAYFNLYQDAVDYVKWLARRAVNKKITWRIARHSRE